MGKMFKYVIVNIIILNIPVVISTIFNFGNTYTLNYSLESVQGIIMFYVAIYGLDRMKKYAINHSQYKDRYEKIVTKERADIFIKFVSAIQLLFLTLLIAIPVSLLKYLDNTSVIYFLFILSFILSFGIGCKYILVIRKNKYVGGYYEKK